MVVFGPDSTRTAPLRFSALHERISAAAIHSTLPASRERASEPNLDASSKLTWLLIHTLFNLEASCRGEWMSGRFRSGAGGSSGFGGAGCR